MNEVLILKAKLAAKKKELEECNLRADGFIIGLREIIDPYTDDFTCLPLDRGKLVYADFLDLWEKAKNLKAEIAKMERDLNG